MRSSSRLVTASSAASICSRSAAILISRAGCVETRIELGDEIGDEAGCDAGMARQRVGDIALRIGRADLAQIAPERAQQRRLAPGEAGRQHELVEAVGFGEAAELRHQRRLDRRVETLDVDLAVVGALQRHVVQPDARIRRAVAGGRLCGVMS